MGIFDIFSKKLSKFTMNNLRESETDIPIFALKFLTKEYEEKKADFAWFMKHTNAFGVILEKNNPSFAWIIYITEDERLEALQIAMERYSYMELEEEYTSIDIEMYNDLVKERDLYKN